MKYYRKHSLLLDNQFLETTLQTFCTRIYHYSVLLEKLNDCKVPIIALVYYKHWKKLRFVSIEELFWYGCLVAKSSPILAAP